MAAPTKIPERQLDLGSAAYFKVVTETVPGNQVKVQPGFVYAGAHDVSDRLTAGEQTTAAFAPVLAAQQRYDLVYLGITGAATVLQGTAVAFGSPVFDGAPGFNLGPVMPDQALAVAYVFVDETGAVVVDTADITQLGGQFQVTRDLQGYLIDKGLFGSAPAGASDVVTALFAGETPSSGTTAGVVTSAPDNYTDLLDQKGDEIKHSTGAKMYGRQTEAAGVWTLTYFYVNAAGAETSMDPSTDTADTAPTDLRLVGSRKIFSRNDPARPMFDSAVGRLSDQIVGDIPTATPTVQGKVVAAASGSPTPPQAGVFNIAQNAGVPVAGGNEPYHTINALGGGLASPAAGVLTLPAAGSPGLLVNQVRSLITGTTSLTVATPRDNTIPQFGEGHALSSVTITPTAVGNVLQFDFIGFGNQGMITQIVFHMHVGTTANAFAAADNFSNSAAAGTAGGMFAFRAYIVGSLPLVSTTYNLRAGSLSGTINGLFYSTARISSFTVTELLP